MKFSSVCLLYTEIVDFYQILNEIRLRLDIHERYTPSKFDSSTFKPVVRVKNRSELERCARKFGYPTNLYTQLLHLDCRAITAEIRPV
ncbi:hypothetical protein AVEN_208428-1 [Araneus ventricosus]|uniref:Uncharacterized protein n=1 Tax=Araneus ventricosus TaxID=182803 RepID=A0A4Y2EHD1_ARAVE|nr:hypothetical protein AVEN_208428-1 [Araneus ventricosus]